MPVYIEFAPLGLAPETKVEEAEEEKEDEAD